MCTRLSYPPKENCEGRLVVTRDYTPHALLLLRRKKRHLAGLSYRSPRQIRHADARGTWPTLASYSLGLDRRCSFQTHQKQVTDIFVFKKIKKKMKKRNGGIRRKITDAYMNHSLNPALKYRSLFFTPRASLRAFNYACKIIEPK